MAKKKSGGMFSGRTTRSMEKPRTSFGYLNVPNNVNIFKPEGGTEVIFDILPYVVTDPEHMDNKKNADDAIVGNPWWKRPILVHRDVGQDGSMVICPTTVGKRCPICAYGAKRRKAGADWDELKEIFPKDRSIFYIVPIDMDDCEVDYEPGEVHIMDQSDFLFTDELLEEVERDVSNDNFPDPYDGLSLQVYWKAKKRSKYKYAEASKIDFIAREEQYDDVPATLDGKEISFEDLPSLDDILVIKDYKELEAMYFGMEDMDDGDVDSEELEEDDAPPRKRKGSSRSSGRSSSRGSRGRSSKKDEEPEEVEEEEGEPEEEEKPKRGSRKPKQSQPAKRGGRRKKDEEPEEEEDPEDEPEEEEKPKGSRRKPRASSKDKCPHGHKFGEDNNQFDECDECKVWEACREANEE